MSSRSLLILATALAAAAGISAQEKPKTWDPKAEPPPKLNEWLPRWKVDRAPMVVTVTPSQIAPPSAANGPCAIPLLRATPPAGGAILQMKPDERGAIRVIEPRVCDDWNVQKDEANVRRPAARR